MFTRSLLTIALLSNAILGHLCMMSMHTDSKEDDKEMTMNMTSVLPMSLAHCEHCADIMNEQKDPPGCDGHCFTQTTDMTSLTSMSGAQPLVAFAENIQRPTFIPNLSENGESDVPRPPGDVAKRSVVRLL